MKKTMQFINTYINTQKIIIHCNQGMSRSPSIGLVYLARIEFINKISYQDAKNDFLQLYREYNPGRGIELYLQNNWIDVLKL